MVATNKYEYVTHELAKKIASGFYPPDTFLPSEKSLQEEYQVSRDTIRKALNTLQAQSMILKINGRGSLVLVNDQFSVPVSKLISLKENFELHDINYESKVLKLEDMDLPTNHFNTDFHFEKVPVTHVERLRIIDGKPAIIDNNYVLKSTVPEIPMEVAENSLFEYFENTLKLSIGFAARTMRVEKATPEQSKILKIPVDEPLVSIRSLTRLKDTRVLELTESFHIASQFKFFEYATRTSL
ncbi:trehalose operon repressor [Lactobacillus terrae]|uniref:trehalose operon repressor n=1 Tax=Lactobacillus terrae TaxID=2269374 RepID=UPI001474F6F2|nr:trehalose operon repressor [Lactobacillus terrae]